MVTKDGRETPIENLTSENYVVPKGEERSYHCVIEVRQFDPKTGKRISKPRLQKFGKKMFESSIRTSLQKQGYEITILHNPTEWIAAQTKAMAEKAKATAKAKKEAEEKAFKDAVAAEVAKQMKALKAEMAKEQKAEKKAKKDASTEDKTE